MKAVWMCLIVTAVHTCYAMSLTEQDGKEQILTKSLDNALNTRQSSNSDFEYRLTVYTSDKNYADTNGQVYVMLVGDKAPCPEMLINDGKRMERKSQLEFIAKCPDDIGQLLRVHVKLTTTDGWHLKRIIVKDLSKRLMYFLNCNCLLDNDNPINPPIRTLTPVQFEYDLIVYTSDVEWADTKGSVYVTLVGDRATCPETLINDGKKMEKNGKLVFTSECPFKIGQLVSVDVRLTTTDGWHLKGMYIKDVYNDLMYTLPCNCWFKNDNPNHPSSRTLTPAQYDYELTVYTSDVEWADTTGKVYVTLVGDKATCPETLINDGKKMDRKSKQIFTTQCPFKIGQLVSVDVRLSSTDGWHLKGMDVKDVYNDLTYILPCYCWFKDESPNHPSSRTLTPVQLDYELTVYTPDVEWAETTGEVYVTLVGDKATCPETLINDGKKMERQSKLTFTSKCPFNIGQLVSVDVRLTTTDGWRLSGMYVKDVLNDVTYTLPCYCWFDNDNSKFPPSRTLTPAA